MPPKRAKRQKKVDADIVVEPEIKSDREPSLEANIERPQSSKSNDQEHNDSIFTLPFGDKSISCQRYPATKDTHERGKSSLIFTHGAGGGMSNPATVGFAEGYSSVDSVLCFQGTMNLKNRVKYFKTVLESEETATALGGRSMGARAAVLTATEHAEQIKAVVLVSFPMTSDRGGDSREDILLGLPDNIDVLFISGDGDKMCNLQHLLRVRKKMRAQSWAVIVKGADHGMSLKPKRVVAAMRERTGQIAAEWLRERNENDTEMVLNWDEEKAEVAGAEWKKGASNKSKKARPGPSPATAETNEEDSNPKPTKRRRRAKE